MHSTDSFNEHTREHIEQRIKYFQIILNSDFLLVSSQNWNCSKSCKLATFELPIGNFDQNL